MIEMNCVYMVLTEKTYPKKLAFSYLEELQREFQQEHGKDIDTAARPYSFVKFGTH